MLDRIGKNKRNCFFRRIIGTVLSTVMIFCCVLGTYALNRGMGTLNRVTDSKKLRKTKWLFMLWIMIQHKL